MNAGDLDTPVQFRRAMISDDGLAKAEEFYDHGPLVFAARRDISDGEKLKAGEALASVTTRFTVRWSPLTADVTPKDRVVCDGREYQIVGIKATGGRQEAFEITAASRSDL